MSRLKPALPWLVTALLLTACLIMPLLFVSPSEPEPDGEALTPAERAELYHLHTEDEEHPFERLDESSVESADVAECMRVVNAAVDGLVMDEGETRVDGPAGMNFYTVSGEAGGIRVLEYYHEWTGDWHNWFTMHIDLDTREIYYLYYSASVQRNGESYLGRAGEHVSAAGEELAQELGFTDGTLEFVEDSLWDLRLVKSGGERRYSAICGIYEDAAPSLIIDLRVTLEGIS